MRNLQSRSGLFVRLAVAVTLVPSLLCLSLPARAQPSAGSATSEQRIDQLTKQVEELRSLVLKLENRVEALQAASAPQTASAAAGAPAARAVTSSTANPAREVPVPVLSAGTAAAPSQTAKTTADFLHGVTINAMLDTYYQYNFNDPIGRVNLLRAYDVSANNFSLSQAALILESAPDMSADKRFGMRIDLQFGQATETLQGNPANELRPEIYRNVYQAYGSYWVPVNGSLLTFDFGKWASSLGIENNYTKDQWNYSRSFWFDYLPFYHSGLRVNYKLNDQLSLSYWLTNGTEQTEDFNNFKDQLLGFTLQPTPDLTWTVNYYLGQEHPDMVYITNPGPGDQNLPMQQGTAFRPIPNPLNGHLQIADTYVTWQATRALSLAAEADYVIDRLYTYSPAQHVTGGALYGRYQFTPKFAVSARGEYLADPYGLYSGVDQFLKEATLTTEYKVADGFLIRCEWRRDASNRPYFLTNTLGVLASHQTTLGFGLVWWLGQKEGPW
jgi:outer membrane murein-binding lipoprotein Lpp